MPGIRDPSCRGDGKIGCYGVAVVLVKLSEESQSRSLLTNLRVYDFFQLSRTTMITDVPLDASRKTSGALSLLK